MMNLAKLFAPTAASNTKNTPNDKSWPMYPLDAEIHTEPLRVCKALIPYLPFEKQKSLSIFIKAYELMSVVNHFSAIDEWEQPSKNFRESDTWPLDLLHSVKDSLDPTNAYWVDILFKVNDVKNILAAAQSKSPYSSPSDLAVSPKEVARPSNGTSQEFLQNISPMLDDHQKQLLDMLSTIMK